MDTPCDASMMSDTPVTSPMMGDITYHCKTPLNIDIYPSTFFENTGLKYDFERDGVVPGRGGVGVVVQL